jgi:hypothetical protein
MVSFVITTTTSSLIAYFARSTIDELLVEEFGELHYKQPIQLLYTNDVLYHISPGMAGTPPWTHPKKNVEEASHFCSHCWVIPATWPRNEQSSDSTT